MMQAFQQPIKNGQS